MSNEIIVREQEYRDRSVAIAELETRFSMAVRQRELLANYIREQLKPDKHLYKVDGAEKASLKKEGAEIICQAHGLKPHYTIISGPDNPPEGDKPYQITVNCELTYGDKFGGQGIGSANSMITRRDGTRVQRQKDPGLRHNATLKMACKSAYIAATLNSTAASEFFTQDLEDDQTGDFKKAESSESKEHWCSIHKTAFFKRGRMKGYAHPIGDTGEWCNEGDKQEVEVIEGEVAPPKGTPPDPAREIVRLKAQLREVLKANGLEGKSAADWVGQQSLEKYNEAPGNLTPEDWLGLVMEARKQFEPPQEAGDK